MDLFEVIAKRHSYRGPYQDRPVPREDLQKIVQAGIQAPSGCNCQSTSFVIIDDPDIMARVNKLVGKSAPAAIVCVTDPTPAYGDTSFQVEDCSAAVENMLLAATALGYASLWLDGVLRRGSGEELRKMLGVPEGKSVQILLPVGIPAEKGVQAERHPFGERAWFSKYGG
jgi:nitroreductase